MVSHLNAEQIRFFRHNGFLKLPALLPILTVQVLKDAVWHDIKGEVEPLVRDVNGQVVRLSQVLDRADLFHQVVTHQLVLDPLESLLGKNIEIVKNRHNHATLNVASRNTDRFHRDVMQWSRGLLTVIFFLEKTTIDNGCTVAVPGSHLLPGLSYHLQVDREKWIAESGIMDQAVPVPMPAGGMLAIDSLVFHRIGNNHTDRTRMSVTIGYRAVDELAGVEDPKALLVRGERPYGGNDRQ